MHFALIWLILLGISHIRIYSIFEYELNKYGIFEYAKNGHSLGPLITAAAAPAMRIVRVKGSLLEVTSIGLLPSLPWSLSTWIGQISDHAKHMRRMMLGAEDGGAAELDVVAAVEVHGPVDRLH